MSGVDTVSEGLVVGELVVDELEVELVDVEVEVVDVEVDVEMAYPLYETHFMNEHTPNHEKS